MANSINDPSAITDWFRNTHKKHPLIRYAVCKNKCLECASWIKTTRLMETFLFKTQRGSPPFMKEEFQHTVFDFTPQPGIQDFWVVTACNPDSQIHTGSFNKAADEKLEQLLKDESFTHFRVTGGSPDGLHAEPGWGISCDEQTAMRLCAKFQQDAVFHFSGDRITLVSRDGQSRIQLEGTVRTRMSIFR